MSKRMLRRIGKQMEVGVLVFSLLFMQVAPGLQATAMAAGNGGGDEQVTETIAQWDFNSDKGDNSVSDYESTKGSGSISLNGADFQGILSDGGANAANANDWSKDDYWQVTVDTSGYENITVSSDHRSSGKGPKDFALEYSVDDRSSWNEVATATLDDNLTNRFDETVGAVDGQDSVKFRWKVTSNDSVGGGAIGTIGTSAIDNIEVTGDVKSYPVMIEDKGYASISAALDTVSNGQTVTVDGGYIEERDIEIDTKDVILESNGKSQSTIKGNVKVIADGVTVDGFKINGASGSPLDIQAGNITITNNTVEGGNNAGGISPWTGTGPITGTVDISNNTVNNGPIGLYLNGQANITIKDNIINGGAGEGIWLAKDFQVNSPDVNNVTVSIKDNDISNVAKKDIKISADIEVNSKNTFTEIAKAVLNNNTANSILLADGQVYDSDGRVVVEEKKEFAEGEKGSVQVAKGVKVSAVDGSDINLGDLEISDVSQVTKGSGEDKVASLQAVKFGLDERNLTFSKPVSITLNVSGVDGQTLDVYRKPEGENENFEKLTTCTVDGGQCTFETTKASTFAVFPDTEAPQAIEGLKITQNDVNVGGFLNEEEQKNNVKVEWKGNGEVEGGYDENFKQFKYKNAKGTVNSLTNSFFEGRIGGDSPEDGKMYTYQVRAVDQEGNKGAWEDVSVTLDFTNPEVSIDSPSENDVVSGDQVTLQGTASDTNLDTVEFEVLKEGSPINQSPITETNSNGDEYTADWDTTGLNGEYTIRLAATDEAGNSANSQGVTVEVDNATPSATVNSPMDGETYYLDTADTSEILDKNGDPVEIDIEIDDANLKSYGYTLENRVASESGFTTVAKRNITHGGDTPATITGFVDENNSSISWKFGEYTLELTADDTQGNTVEKTITFSVKEQPQETEDDTTSDEQDSEETGNDQNDDKTEQGSDQTDENKQEESAQNIIDLKKEDGDTAQAQGEEDISVKNEQGEEVDTSDLVFETVEKEEKDGQKAVNSVKFGVEGENLTFSNPVTITLNVGSEFNGEILDVFRRPEGENAELTQEGLIDTTCEVSEGQCSFQTTKASTFSVFAQVTEETEKVDETAPQVDFMVPEDKATYTLMVPMNEQGTMGESILMDENGEEVTTKIEITDDNLTSYGYTLENRIPDFDDEYFGVAAREMTVERDMATITEFEIAEGVPFEWGIGEYRLTVTAEDEQGNTTEEVITFQVEFSEEMMNQIPEGGFLLDEESINQLLADLLADEELQGLIQEELQGFTLDEEAINQIVSDLLADEEVQGFIQDFLKDLQESELVLDTDAEGNLVLTSDGEQLLTITPEARRLILEELDLSPQDLIDLLPDGFGGPQMPELGPIDRDEFPGGLPEGLPEGNEDLLPIDPENPVGEQPQDRFDQDDFAGGGGIPQDDFAQDPSTPTSGDDEDDQTDSDEDTSEEEDQEEDRNDEEEANEDEQEEDTEEDIELDDELSDIEEEQDEEENNGLGATIGNFVGTFFSSWWGWVITLLVIFGFIGGVIKKNASV